MALAEGNASADSEYELHMNFYRTTSCPEALENARIIKDDKKNYLRIRYALALCIAFFIVEIAAGIYARSLAILSDGFHLLSDVAGMLVSLVSLHLSRLPATANHTYGFYRVEVLGALLSTFIIWAMTGILVWEAVQRIRHPEEINAQVMFWTALIGILVNILIACALHYDHSGHDHQDSHRVPRNGVLPTHESDCDLISEEEPTRRMRNLNIESAFVHVLGDIISSLGVFIASIVLLLRPKYVIVDPICTFVFSAIVLFTTFRIILNSMAVLMEATPKDINMRKVTDSLMSIDGVSEVHHMHIWNLTIGKPSLSAHLKVNLEDVNDSSDSFSGKYSKILYTAQDKLCSKLGIHHATIQIELEELKDSVDINAEYLASQSSAPQSKATRRTFGLHCETTMCHVDNRKT